MSQIRFIVLVQICSLGKQPRYYGAFGNFQCDGRHSPRTSPATPLVECYAVRLLLPTWWSPEQRLLMSLAHCFSRSPSSVSRCLLKLVRQAVKTTGAES